jgi:copper resistance protein B
MAFRRALLLLTIAAASPAGAQRLSYEDVLAAEHQVGPRLSYEPFVEETAPPLPGDEPDNVRAFYGDRLEWRPQRGADGYGWDVSAELGGPAHRLWLSTTGDGVFGGPVEYLETQALYSHPVTESGLAVQAGVRQDFVPRPRRSYAALGMQGNVSDPLYVGAFGFLSHRGELTGRAFAYYDQPLGRRFVLQPSVEGEIAAQDVAELAVGAGPIYVEAGLRLRYRVADGFSPYVGVSWERLLGRTARFAREEGDQVEATNVVIGVRSYFE